MELERHVFCTGSAMRPSTATLCLPSVCKLSFWIVSLSKKLKLYQENPKTKSIVHRLAYGLRERTKLLSLCHSRINQVKKNWKHACNVKIP